MYTEKDLKSAANIITRIAQEHNVPEAQVRAEMQEAINTGRASTDPAVQAKWEEFQFAGEEPTLEEFILWIASKV